MEELNSEAAAITHALATGGYPFDELELLEKCMAFLLDTSSQEQDVVPEVRTAVVTDVLPTAARTLFERGFAPEMAARVNSFFKELIAFLVTLLPEKARPHLELLNLLLAPCKTGFYANCGWDDDGSLAGRDDDPGAAIVKAGAWKGSRFLLENIKCFASSGGFSRATTVLHEKDVPIWAVKLIIQPFCRIRDILEPVLLEQMVITWMKVVCDRLLDMDEETMKNAEGSDIQNIKIYLRLLGHEVNAGLRQLEFCSLELAMKLLKSSTLAKRLAGFSDIAFTAKSLIPSELPTVPTESESPELKLITADFLNNWIRQEGLLQLVFGANGHPQIMQRAGPILLFLAKTDNLQMEDLDMVWAAGENKHESLVHIVYGLFAEICSVLSMEHIEYLFAAKIKAIAPSDFDAPTFTLLRSLSLRAIPMEPSGSSLDDKEDLATSSRFFGIHFAWDMLQDATFKQLSKDSKGHALAVVRDFLGWQLCFGLREVFLTRCLENLKRFATISNSLKVAMAALNTFAQEGVEGPLLCRLDEEQLLLSVVFHALTEYKRQAAVAAKEAITAGLEEGQTVDNLILCGTMTHEETMQDFLVLLEFVVNHSSLMLNKQQIDSLWESLVVNTISAGDQNRAFRWLEGLRATAKPGCTPFTDEDSNYMLLKKVPTLDFAALSLEGYQLAQRYFYHANLSMGTLPQQVHHSRLMAAADKAKAKKAAAEAGEGTSTADDTAEVASQAAGEVEPLCGKLVGTEIIWRAALEIQDDTASKRAMAFLSTLYKSPLEGAACKSHVEHELLVSNCFSHMSSPIIALRSGTADADNCVDECTTAICRCLQMLKYLVEEHAGLEQGEEQGHGAITKGSPLTVKITGALKGVKVVVHSNDRLCVLRGKVAELLASPPSCVRIFALGKELKVMKQTVAQVGIKNDFSIIAAVRKGHERGETAATADTESEAMDTAVEGESVTAAVEVTPRQILSRTKFFEQLFSMLNMGAGIAQSTWDLLMLLPTNRQMMSDLRNCASSTAEAAPAWNRTLDPTSVFKLLYTLQIVQSVIDKELQEGGGSWCSWFASSGGVAHLVRVLTTADLMQEARGPKRRICMVQLLRVISQFTLMPREQEGDSNSAKVTAAVSCMDDLDAGITTLRGTLLLNAVEPETELVNQLMTLCWNAAPTAAQEGAGEEETEEVGEIIRIALLLLVTLCTEKEELLLHLWAHQHLKAWLERLVCRTTNQRVRAIAGDAVLQLCSDRVPADLMSQSFTVFVTKLLQLLPELGHDCKTAEELYSTLCILLEQSLTAPEKSALPCTPEQLYNELVHWLCSHPVVEERDSDEDHVLKGSLNLLTVLAKLCPALQKQATVSLNNSGATLVDFLFHQCLFSHPTSHGDSAAASGKKEDLPLCKAPATRSSAFELLEELASDNAANRDKLLALLCAQHESVEERSEWQYSPTGMSKAASGFVGLVNQGATCYMNSLLQQLYMTPGFRRDLLKIEGAAKSEDERKESVLHQLQMIFCGLKESNQRAYDTIGLCRAFKDFEGNPVNPGLQMDADEFCNMLFDKLEMAMKDLGEENAVKRHFGGELCNQVISKDCGHVSETVEPFYSVSVAVKGKSSLETSLELYVEGDMLEGDNKYHCSICNAKVDALKRCCVLSLPETLIIHMRRFEFNLEYMRRMKVNDYCSFPLTLDMEPYTKQGLDKADGVAPKEGGPPLHPKSYFKYELVGVLVHTGTAESGHYYSFIKDRSAPPAGALSSSGNWCQFNDQSVDPWNKDNLAYECFGGLETVTHWDSAYQKQVQQSRLRVNNAYMLIYQRMGAKEAAELETYRNEELSALIWKENERFWRDKHTFDDQYFSFMAAVCKPRASVEEGEGEVAQVKSRESLATIQMATNYFLGVLCRAREEDTMGTFVGQLKDMYCSSQEACTWLLNTAVEKDWITVYLLACRSSRTRQMVAGLLVHVLGAMAAPTRRYLAAYLQQEEQAALRKVATIAELKTPADAPATIRYLNETVNHLLRGAEDHWRRFMQFFIPLRAFCKFGPIERRYVLAISLPARLIHFYVGERSPLLPGGPLAQMEVELKRPIAVMGDKFAPPRASCLVDIVSELARCCATRATAAHGLSPVFGPPSVSQAVIDPTEAEPEPAAVPGPPRPLAMGPLDEQLLYSEAFHMRLLVEGVSVSSSLLLLQHLVWQDQQFSRDVLDVIASGMAASDEEAQDSLLLSFAGVLEVEDEFRAWRHSHGMQAFVKCVESCVHVGASFPMVKFISDLALESALVNDWLFSNMDAWLGPWLIVHKNDEVRYKAMELAQAFLEDMGDTAAAAEVSAEAVRSGAAEPPPIVDPVDPQRTMVVFQRLLSLLGTARFHMAECFFTFERKELQHGQAPGTSYYATVERKCYPWKLVSYFQLLRECVVNDSFREVFFDGHWPAFFAFYEALDGLKQPNDYNKRELLLFLDWCFAAADDNNLLPADVEEPAGAQLTARPSIFCQHLTGQPAMVARFLNNHLTIGHEEYLRYNKAALPTFYRTLLRCSLASEGFLVLLLRHENFLWAIEKFYLCADYPLVAAALFDIIRLGLANSPDFAARLVPLVLSRDLDRLSHRRLVSCLGLLVTNEAGARRFCHYGGPSAVAASTDLLALENRGYGPAEATEETVGERETGEELSAAELSRIADVLAVLVAGVEWMGEGRRDPALLEAACAKWPDRTTLLPTLCSYLERIRSDEVLALTYRLLKVLCLVDKQFLENVVLLVHQEHVNYAHACGLPQTALLGAVNGVPRFKAHLPAFASEPHVHEQYYAFLRRLCRIALIKFFTTEEEAAYTVNLGLLGVLESTHVTSECRLMCSALVSLWHSQVPLRRLLQRHTLLAPLVVRAFTRDQRLLDLDECMRLVSLAFGSVADSLSEEDRATIVVSVSSRIDAVASLLARPDADTSEAAGQELLRLLKTVTTTKRSPTFRAELLKPRAEQIAALAQRARQLLAGPNAWPADEIAAHIVSLSN